MAHNIEDSKELLKIWQELNGTGEEKLKGLLEKIFQKVLEAKMDDHIGANKYERTSERKDYRNGHRARKFKTRMGTLELEIPQDRSGTFDPEIFEKYQRSEKAFLGGMIEMYLGGVSTRRVSNIVEKLCGISISKSQLSVLVKSIDKEVKIWRNRELTKSYPLLIVDARYEKIRKHNKIVSNGVLIVVGISEDGYREILGTWIADGESEFSWSKVFSELKDRGLTGVEYIVSDAHKGLKKAIDKHFVGCLWQRCYVHFLRNILSHTNIKNRGEIISLMDGLKFKRNIDEAREELKFIVSRLEELKFNKIAEMVDLNGEDIIAFYHLPKAFRKRMYTSNMIERLMQEYKRRTKVIRIFPNEESCLRLITALSIEISEKWMNTKYFNMELFGGNIVEKQKILKTA